ncbi:hypothetical protein HY628_00745 [Candidatus Uhrbacteria bacterium]|nr:hypothetical protein [Candidatus Uhrbacteria bacterium]
MTRTTETPAPVSPEVKTMVEERVRQALRGRRFLGPWRSCCGCLLLNLCLGIIFAALIALALAKTGLVRVPFFSRFYEPPRPSRWVTPQEPSLESVINSQLARQRKNEPLTIRLTEETLSAALRQALPPEKGRLGHVQVALSDGVMEIFVELPRPEKSSALRLWIIPFVENGSVSFRVKRVEIGELRIWHRLVNAFLKPAASQSLEPLQNFSIGDISVQNGTLELKEVHYRSD